LNKWVNLWGKATILAILRLHSKKHETKNSKTLNKNTKANKVSLKEFHEN
jgi:hypothetical protein